MSYSRLCLAIAAASMGFLGCVAGAASVQPSPGDDDEGADGADASPVGDVGDAAPIETGTTYGPFEAPQLITALSAPGYVDSNATVTADQKEIYFNSDRPGGAGLADLYVSTRDTLSDPWRAPSLVANLNTEHVETAPEVSRDGLRLYFSSDRPGGAGGLDIYMVKRNRRTSTWSNPVNITAFNSPANDMSPVANRQNTDLVFTSSRAGSNDLYLVQRASAAATWGTPAPLGALNTGDSESDAFLDNDGLVLYYASGVAGLLDIRRATRHDLTEDFALAEPVDALNTTSNEADPWVNNRDTYMVITSERTGDADLYEARRTVIE